MDSCSKKLFFTKHGMVLSNNGKLASIFVNILPLNNYPAFTFWLHGFSHRGPKGQKYLGDNYIEAFGPQKAHPFTRPVWVSGRKKIAEESYKNRILRVSDERPLLDELNQT